MATVPDKSTNTPTDRPYSSPNRKNAGSPIGSLTPLYSGEIVQDTTNGVFYYASGKTSADWVLATVNG